MKEEIKEILDNLIRYRNEDNKFQPEDILTIEDVWLLLDYITNLQEELKLKTNFIEELLTIISVARDYELHDKCYTRSKIYQDKLRELKGE